jgi:hypothetical protein
MHFNTVAFDGIPDIMLMNGKGPFGHQLTKAYESFIVTKGTLEVETTKKGVGILVWKMFGAGGGCI